MSGINENPFDLPEFDEDAVPEGLSLPEVVQLPPLPLAEAAVLLTSLGVIASMVIAERDPEHIKVVDFMVNALLHEVRGRHLGTLASLTERLRPLVQGLDMVTALGKK
jgi:hypothetical protein